jgi:hypothetical protein
MFDRGLNASDFLFVRDIHGTTQVVRAGPECKDLPQCHVPDGFQGMSVLRQVSKYPAPGVGPGPAIFAPVVRARRSRPSQFPDGLPSLTIAACFLSSSSFNSLMRASSRRFSASMSSVCLASSSWPSRINKSSALSFEISGCSCLTINQNLNTFPSGERKNVSTS